MRGLTWLHLSDWHQGAPDFDRKIVSDALIRDIQTRSNIDPSLSRIDFVVFSGDLAFSGTPGQYEAAKKELLDPVLKAVELDTRHLFCVPGNHDLNREHIYEMLPPELQNPITSEDVVQKWLTSDERRRRVLEPFQGYTQFISTYTQQPTADYASIVWLEADGKRVALLGLNSSWMCGRNKEAQGRINDYGYVLVGEPQLHDALREIADADVRIAVMHHPLAWLAEFDKNRIESRLKAEVHFLLHGHEHKPGVSLNQSTDGECIFIPAGSSYDRRVSQPHYVNAYNFVHLDFETGSGTVYLRRWNDQKSEWSADYQSYLTGKFLLKSLPKALGRPERSAAAAVSEPPPPVQGPAVQAGGPKRPDVGQAPELTSGAARLQERFVGRQAVLGDLTEAYRGLILRQQGLPTEGPAEIRVAWYHGFGGMGKSWLLRKSLIEASAQFPALKLGLVDWDGAQSQFRAPLLSDPLTLEDLLQPVAYRLAQLYGPDMLNPYWEADQRADAAEHDRASLLHAFQEEVDRLKRGEEIGEPLIAVLSKRNMATTGEARMKTVENLRQNAPLREAVLQQWYDNGGYLVTDRYAVLRPGELRLGALRDCIRNAAMQAPLVLAFDTCEILSADLDASLRELVAPLCTGSLPLLVVIGSRLPPDAGALSSRDTWRERLEGGRLRIVKFDEHQRLSMRDISAMSARILGKVPSDALVNHIHKLTLGVPLAVRTLFDLLQDNGRMAQVTEIEDEEIIDELTDKEAEERVVGRMTDRFLQHLENHPGRETDLHSITLLALFKELDHETLARFWPGVHIDTRLRELATRYGLLARGDLHETVRSFLRRRWLAGERASYVQQVIDEFVAVVDQVPLPGEPGDDEYMRVLALKLNARLWAAGADSVSSFAPALALALAFQEGVDEVLALASKDELTPPKKGPNRDAVRLLHRLSNEFFVADEPWEDAGLMEWLIREREKHPAEWSPAQLTALDLLEGLQRHAAEDWNRALPPLLRAFDAFRTLPVTPRKNLLAAALFDCAYSLAKGSDTAEPVVRAYEAASALDYEQAACANNIGHKFHELKQLDEAERYYRRAIELSPTRGLFRRNLAILLRDTRRRAEAEAELRGAIQVDPTYADAYTELTRVLGKERRDEVESILRKTAADNPASAQVATALAFFLEEKGREAGSVDEAVAMYERALGLDASYARAHWGLGLLEENRRNWDAAEQHYRKAVDLDPDKAIHPYLLGRLLARVREKDAEPWLRQAIALDPYYLDPCIELRNVLIARGAFPEAETVVQAAVERNPRSARAWIVLGDFLRQRARTTEAEAAYRRAIAVDAEYAPAWNSLGILQQDRGDITAAESAYQHAAELEPEEVVYPYNLARVLAGRDAPEAEAVFRKAIAVNPNYVDAYSELAKLLQKKGKAEAAEAILRSAVACNPRSAHSFALLGDFLRKQERLPEAASAYQDAIAIDPQYAYAYNGLGIVEENMGNTAGAAADYRKAHSLDKTDAAYPYNLGRLLSSTQPGEAETWLRKAIEINPGYIEAPLQLRTVLVSTGRMSEAEAPLRHALEHNPKSPRLITELGYLMRDLGRVTEGEAAFRQAMELDAAYVPAYTALAMTITGRDGSQEAELLYRKAIELAPSDPAHYAALSYLLAQQNLDQAEVVLRDAVQRDPKSPQAWTNLGHFLRERDRGSEAETAYRQALEADSRHAEACYGMGMVHENRGKLEEAERSYTTACELAPKEALYVARLARVLAATRRPEEAERHYHKALELDAANYDAYEGLWNLLDSTGRIGEAQTILRVAVDKAPQNGVAHNGLAWIMYKRGGDLREAEGLAAKATGFWPGSGGVWHTLGTIQMKQSGWAAAAEALKHWIDNPLNQVFDEADTAETFQMALDAGQGEALRDMLRGARNPVEWEPWLKALAAVEAGGPEPPPPAGRLFQALKKTAPARTRTAGTGH